MGGPHTLHRQRSMTLHVNVSPRDSASFLRQTAQHPRGKPRVHALPLEPTAIALGQRQDRAQCLAVISGAEASVPQSTSTRLLPDRFGRWRRVALKGLGHVSLHVVGLALRRLFVGVRLCELPLQPLRILARNALEFLGPPARLASKLSFETCVGRHAMPLLPGQMPLRGAQ